MSKIDEVGPIQYHEAADVLRVPLARLGEDPLSILSHGSDSWEMSYIRFCSSRWIAGIGRKGMKRWPTSTENTLPKLELAVMFRYFMMLPKVSRPLITPLLQDHQAFSRRMMSADSLGDVGAASTEMPTSASRSAGRR